MPQFILQQLGKDPRLDEVSIALPPASTRPSARGSHACNMQKEHGWGGLGHAVVLLIAID